MPMTHIQFTHELFHAKLFKTKDADTVTAPSLASSTLLVEYMFCHDNFVGTK
jgi:hypothetical protein